MPISIFKVLLVGDPNVGKSSLIRRLLLGEFDENYQTTIGVDLSAVVIDLAKSTPTILTLVDLGGQKEFSNLRTHYYKDAHFSLLVYDISNRDSFDALPGWFDGMAIALNRAHKDLAPGFLIGNKADMEDTRVVPYQEGKLYASTIGWNFVETSAKTGLNVEETFTSIAKYLEENQSLSI
jgi:small GTP-binding protein